MYQRFANDFQLTNMDSWDRKIDLSGSSQYQCSTQHPDRSQFSRSVVSAGYSANSYNSVHAFNYNNNINHSSRFYQTNGEHLPPTPRSGHFECSSNSKLFNPFNLNTEISANSWSAEERSMTTPLNQTRSYNYPQGTTSTSLQANHEARDNTGIENFSTRALSSVVSEIPPLNLGRTCTSREFSQNAIIRSKQSPRTDSGYITANPYSDYFKTQKLAEKIPPPVVKVEEGYDRPVPAKRAHSLKLTKSSKVVEYGKGTSYENPFTNDNPFTNNWIVQKSESQRIMEEHIATMTEVRDWQNSFCPDVSKSNVTEGKSSLESEQTYKCDWSNCGLICSEQDDLVRHIEKVHIDQRKADDSFVCYWKNCVRKQKPFNARYKLVIHMRVHSGERPNRCTVK